MLGISIPCSMAGGQIQACRRYRIGFWFDDEPAFFLKNRDNQYESGLNKCHKNIVICNLKNGLIPLQAKSRLFYD